MMTELAFITKRFHNGLLGSVYRKGAIKLVFEKPLQHPLHITAKNCR